MENYKLLILIFLLILTFIPLVSLIRKHFLYKKGDFTSKYVFKYNFGKKLILECNPSTFTKNEIDLKIITEGKVYQVTEDIYYDSFLKLLQKHKIKSKIDLTSKRQDIIEMYIRTQENIIRSTLLSNRPKPSSIDFLLFYSWEKIALNIVNSIFKINTNYLFQSLFYSTDVTLIKTLLKNSLTEKINDNIKTFDNTNQELPEVSLIKVIENEK